MPITNASSAWPKPFRPSRQMTINAPTANSMAITAMPTAPPNFARPGTISMKSSRTTTIASNATASANSARRRAQMASRDVGSSAMRRRGMEILGSRADAFERAPLGRAEKSGLAARRRGSFDRLQPVLRVRMVEQKLHAGTTAAVDAHQDGAECARIGAELGDELDRI